MSRPPITDVVPSLVSEAPIPLVLVDLRTGVIEAVSQPLLDLVRRSRNVVVGRLVTEFSTQPAATAAHFGLLVDGQLDGYHTIRKIWRGDGTSVECTIWVRMLDPDRDRTSALIVLGPRSEPDWQPASSVGGPPVMGVVDHRWRILSVSTDVERLLGVPSDAVIGLDTFAGVHRSDHADLLVTTAAVIADRSTASVRLRVRHADGRWIRVLLQISLLAGGPPWTYAFTMTPVCAAEAGQDAKFEEHLRRIALEVRAAGVMRVDASPDELDEDVLPIVDGLTERQWEIVSRLLAGDRVPTIARELYLSQSTVRNHLADVFGRFGVHSQEELLRALRRRKDGSPRTT